MATSERMLGKALAGKREDAIIATKVYFPSSGDVNRLGASRLAIMREVEGSLERLGTDRIDLYQLHQWDASTPIEETLRALDECVKQGKVRYIGLCNSYGLADRKSRWSRPPDWHRKVLLCSGLLFPRWSGT